MRRSLRSQAGNRLLCLYVSTIAHARLIARRLAMPVPEDIRPLLADVKSALQELYGDRLDQVILYGSYARGEAHEESDVDLLVVLTGPVDAAKEIRRMGDVRTNLGLKYTVAISLLPHSRSEFDQEDSGWAQEVSMEGMRV